MSPPSSSTALHLLSDQRHTRRLSLGCPHLDALLGGGLDVCGLTEIAGEAGSGKTQLVLQLLLQAQLPCALGGLSGGAVYLHSDTANADPALRRMHSMATAFAHTHSALGAEVEMLKQQVFVLQVDTPQELWNVLNDQLPTFLDSTSVRILAIDSIGGLYRAQDDDAIGGAQTTRAGAAAERAQHAMRVAARLKKLAEQFNLAAVVTNQVCVRARAMHLSSFGWCACLKACALARRCCSQVSDIPLDATQRRLAPPWELGPCGNPDGTSARVPALGPAWACTVNTRIVLTRHEMLCAATGGSEWRRQLHMVWSPRMAEASVRVEVREQGLVGLPMVGGQPGTTGEGVEPRLLRA